MAHVAGRPATIEAPIRQMQTVASTLAVAGDTTVISAPGPNARIVIERYHLGSEAAAVNIVRLKNGNTPQRRIYFSAVAQEHNREFRDGTQWRLSENAALVIELSATQQINYDIDYWIENV